MLVGFLITANIFMLFMLLAAALGYRRMKKRCDVFARQLQQMSLILDGLRHRLEQSEDEKKSLEDALSALGSMSSHHGFIGYINVDDTNIN